MTNKRKIKIGVTVVWVILGFMLMNYDTHDPINIGESLQDSGIQLPESFTDNMFTEGRYWYQNFGAFLLFMIPVFGMWIYTWMSQSDTKDKRIKRRSRMH